MSSAYLLDLSFHFVEQFVERDKARPHSTFQCLLAWSCSRAHPANAVEQFNHLQPRFCGRSFLVCAVFHDFAFVAGLSFSREPFVFILRQKNLVFDSRKLYCFAKNRASARNRSTSFIKGESFDADEVDAAIVRRYSMRRMCGWPRH